ncbi:MAG: VWA domain-containing protein [Bradymonadales bacterium]|nr:VWA domain-containing protein [Bradymonadales bacterium]
MYARRVLSCSVALSCLLAVALVWFVGGGRASAQVGTNPLDIRLVPHKRIFLPEERQAVVMLEVNASPSANRNRAPVAMALVIDTSGSMDGQKIRDARTAAHALVDRLVLGDMVTVITYSSSASLLLANYVIGSDRSAAHRAIEQVRATGSTCISCGVERGYNLLGDSSRNFNRRLVLLSDGNANVGISDPHGLRALASAALERFGVPTSTIGLGFDYNEDLMVAMANGGAGAYYFLPNSDAIAAVLDREFSQLDTVVASNLVIEVAPAHGVSFGSTEIPGLIRQGDRILINLGQIPAGSQRQILVPIQLPEGDLGEVLNLRATYEDASGSSRTLSENTSLSRSSSSREVEASQDAGVMARMEQVESQRAVQSALETYQRGDRSGAVQQLRETATRLQQGSATLAAPTLAAEAADIQMLTDYLAEDEGVSEERVDGLRRHNRARTLDMDRGASGGEMYHESVSY